MEAGYRADIPTGYQQITTLTAAVGFTIPSGGAQMAIVTVESQAVRWRDDGTDPTASVGMPLAVAQSIIMTERQLSTIKFIEQAVGAKLNISYYV